MKLYILTRDLLTRKTQYFMYPTWMHQFAKDEKLWALNVDGPEVINTRFVKDLDVQFVSKKLQFENNETKIFD